MGPESHSATAPGFEANFRSRLVELAYFAAEYLLISLCSPKGPGRLMRLVFKSGVLYYPLGLGNLVGSITLLLTTTGRKTGKPRVTPLAYRHHPSTDTYYVVAGWGEHSDWVRNLKANPKGHVRVCNRKFDAVAERAPLATALEVFSDYKSHNPFAARVWTKLTGIPFEDSEAGLCDLAARQPVIALRPVR